ncbi:type IX secretion system plug protein [Prevotella ihumii]|uniref:type IX secretion system plug protein n=1 Tax=Prevotella ihumii TaxID=1917878 RepID=UPI0009817520|nr:DUF5103 domain-containing protein [Prevotella ihumii]
MKHKQPIVLLVVLLLSIQTLTAQRHEVLATNIRSLQVVANEDWQSMPIMELEDGVLDIDFDDMTHEYHRYTYTLEHCEANWQTTTTLFESDYVEGFAKGNTIEDVEQSLLTNTLYTHYHLSIPNKKCRPKISGNYRLTVYDADENPIIKVCFMVKEPFERSMGVGLNVTTNTDVDINGQFQQVEMDLKYGGYSVTNPEKQLKTIVLQNRRWDNARSNAKPQYVMSDGLRWIHCPNYIFVAGNEYRKFEILSTNVATMGIDHIGWDGKDFHAYPYIASPRLNYLYDQDANGAFLIRNSDNRNIHTESDYMQVHFVLEYPQRVAGDVYVNGDWTNDRFLPQYRLEYNEETHCYETVIPMKLGYYSYQYLMVDTDGKPKMLPIEGSFYQTENSYQALVYYREQGGRTDRLVGYTSVNFTKR